MMRNPLRRSRTFGSRFAQDRSGLALTEFALALPVLLTLGMFGVETANLALAHLLVAQIAATTADNAGRAGASGDPTAAIDEADINELLTGARMIGSRIDFAAHGRIILSDLEPTTDLSKQWIRWQRCTGAKNVASTYGVPKQSNGTVISNGTEMTAPSDQTKSTPTNGTAATPTTGMGPVGRQIMASTNPATAVMFVEVQYDYQPVVTSKLFGAQVLKYTSAFNVRQRTTQSVNNAGNLSGANLSTCNRFSAT